MSKEQRRTFNLVVPGLSAEFAEQMRFGNLQPDQVVSLLTQSPVENPHAHVQKHAALAYLDTWSRQVWPVVNRMEGEMNVDITPAPYLTKKGFYATVDLKKDGVFLQSSSVFDQHEIYTPNRAGLTLLHHITNVHRPKKEVETDAKQKLRKQLNEVFTRTYMRVIYEYDKNTDSPYEMYEGKAIVKGAKSTVSTSHLIRERTLAQFEDVASQDLLRRLKKLKQPNTTKHESTRRGKRMAPPRV